MTLTLNNSAESTTAGKQGTSSQGSENKAGTSPRSNPVCLEVIVTVRGLPAESGDSKGSTGPVREQGRTVIVFDNGAVIRLSKNLPAGQKLILSNPQGRDVVCRVVNGRNLPSVKGYVEVEFVEQTEDFWRIHLSEPVTMPAALPTPVSSSQPISTVPPDARPVAPLVPARPAGAEKSVTSPPGSAPTFEDVAGLVRMSPPPSPVRVKVQAQSPKSASESGKARNDTAETPESISMQASSVPVDSPEMAAIPAAQDSSSVSAPKAPAAGHFMAGGMLASAQTSSIPSTGGYRKGIPLALGGVALLLTGFGAAYFYMHQGSAAAPTAPEVTAVQSPAQVSDPAAPLRNHSVAETVQKSQPLLENDVNPSQPTATIAAVKSEVRDTAPADTSSLDAPNNRRKAIELDAPPPVQTSKQREQIPNLKLHSPIAPKQDSAKLLDAPAPSITEMSFAALTGTAPVSAMAAPAARAGNQPVAPSWLASSPATGKTIRDPKLFTSTAPIYPSVAKQSNTQGTVVIQAEVDQMGNVSEAKAISGPTSLRQAAIDAVRRWKYLPALINGKPATAQVTINVQFRLN